VNIADLMIRRFRAAGGAAEEAGVKAAHGLALAESSIGQAAAADATTAARRTVKLTASQRNTFFDNALSRILKRGGLQDLQGQLSAITKAEGLLKERLAKTKDVTRRLNLEDQILELASQAKSIRGQIVAARLDKRQQAFSDVISALQLNVTKAQARPGFADDIGALERLQAGLRAEIKSLGATADLQSQLFDVAQQISQAKQARISASEFFTLGLDATGQDRVPLAANLRKRLGTLSEAVKGTFLDTNKTRKELAAIRKVLSSRSFRPMCRAKVKELLDGVADELKNGAKRNQTKFRHASTSALLAGLGFSPDQTRELRQRLAQVGALGTVPGARSAALAGGSGANTTTNLTVNLDGQTVAKVVTKHQNRANGRRAVSRRGPYAGRH
jgi:hypothetical protein